MRSNARRWGQKGSGFRFFRFDEIVRLDVKFVEHILRDDLNGRTVGSFKIDAFRHLASSRRHGGRAPLRGSQRAAH